MSSIISLGAMRTPLVWSFEFGEPSDCRCIFRMREMEREGENEREVRNCVSA